MKEKKNNQVNAQQEINLKLFFRKIYKNKMFFMASIGLFVLLALIYIAVATPIYEVSTSVLIDSKGRNRVLGDSEYVEGGVSLIEMEKNLYNEIGILKSFSLIRQTIEDLSFDVSYYTKSFLSSEEEKYGYFPFEVFLDRSKPQLYGVPFEIELLSDDSYRLNIEGDEFGVSNPLNGSVRDVERSFDFSGEYKFGDTVEHEYFTFTLNRPEYSVNDEDFDGDDLSFVINNIEGVTKNYMGKLEADNIDIQASIFKIVSSGPIVSKEVDFLKKLTQNYVQNELSSRTEIAAGKEAFIRNQLRVISDSLNKFEVKLEAFKRDKKAVDLGATASNALDQTNNLQVEAAKIKMNINYYNSIIRSVKSNRNKDEFIMPSGIGLEDPMINQNILALKELYAERSRKKFYVTSNNEEMTILNGQIKESTELLLNNLRSAVRSSQAALGGITSQLSNIDEQISSLPTREIQLLNIERQNTLYENLYKYLSQELAKTGIARAESTSDTRILDEARMVGNGPVAPQKSLLLALAVVLGMLIPLGWMIFFSPDDTIENVQQVMANSDMPIIASIVHYDNEPKKKRELVVPFLDFDIEKWVRKIKGSEKLFDFVDQNFKPAESDSEVALWKLKESFRDLSTNLKLVNSADKGVIGITSILPEEGKTYSAINLGITLAEAGKKTIIIDADLRNPSLVKGVRKIKGKGLSNYLMGELSSLNEVIHSHEKVKNLKFIPSEIVDGNVHELLSSDKMKSVVEKLKQEYDYVILDTPAVGLVSDFLLLLDVMDINLFVVRRNISKVEFLEDLENLIPRDKKKKSYIIFNDALKEDHKYGYEAKYGLNKEKQLVDKSFSV
ncbi:polysaccharide biosynthesis tyrosine autokinase [Zobellia alginiliquefaciens]|uniref:polysaccharide biosynthesis tyrosine autokinase n=1 Tax=Zobellia alginiliquefaciens TaxID=3032586 RepID=UPI0023E3F0D1|nr:polysaccharide biosynthesis tyrosine autokinase [Zobellia alginiliquefaciens]